MKPLNAQRTLCRAFPTGREALPMLDELKESIVAIARWTGNGSSAFGSGLKVV